MSENQEKMVDQFSEDLGVPASASQQGKLGLTNGQAAHLLDELRAEKGRLSGKPHDAAWFAQMVLDAQTEVPIIVNDSVTSKPPEDKKPEPAWRPRRRLRAGDTFDIEPPEWDKVKIEPEA